MHDYDSDVGGPVDPLTGELLYEPKGDPSLGITYRDQRIIICGAVNEFYGNPKNKFARWIPRTVIEEKATELLPQAWANPGPNDTGNRHPREMAVYSLVRLLWDFGPEYEASEDGRRRWNAWRRDDRRGEGLLTPVRLKRKLKLDSQVPDIWRAFVTLSPRDRAILMATIDLVPQAKLAAEHGVTRETVNRWKRAAVANLKAILSQTP